MPTPPSPALSPALSPSSGCGLALPLHPERRACSPNGEEKEILTSGSSALKPCCQSSSSSLFSAPSASPSPRLAPGPELATSLLPELPRGLLPPASSPKNRANRELLANGGSSSTSSGSEPDSSSSKPRIDHGSLSLHSTPLEPVAYGGATPLRSGAAPLNAAAAAGPSFGEPGACKGHEKGSPPLVASARTGCTGKSGGCALDIPAAAP